MNIFILHEDPVIAASMYCNKHVVKIILEMAQMLSTAHHINNYNNIYLYKATHINHPCTKWVRETPENYNWAVIHFKALLNEYLTRYGKTHKCEQLIEHLLINPINNKIIGSYKGHTPFVQAMPDQYKDKNPVKAYRNYYIGEKSGFAKWKNKTPSWFIKDIK